MRKHTKKNTGDEKDKEKCKLFWVLIIHVCLLVKTYPTNISKFNKSLRYSEYILPPILKSKSSSGILKAKLKFLSPVKWRGENGFKITVALESEIWLKLNIFFFMYKCRGYDNFKF
jgi:hypothetical protein